MGNVGREKIIGILGGMGPEATVELFRRIVEKTLAKSDQNHLRIIIDNNPKIPDRTAAILGGGKSPLPMLVATAEKLERAGADFIIIPCNTAHYWLDELRNAVEIAVLDMIEETASLIVERQVGLLATAGTAHSRLYQTACEKERIKLLLPQSLGQVQVTNVISSVKAGERGRSLREQLVNVARGLVEQGAEAVIVGCTELSLILEQGDLPVPIYDPLTVLVNRAIEKARSDKPSGAGSCAE